MSSSAGIMIIPNIWEKKIRFQTTNQVLVEFVGNPRPEKDSHSHAPILLPCSNPLFCMRRLWEPAVLINQGIHINSYKFYPAINEYSYNVLHPISEDITNPYNYGVSMCFIYLGWWFQSLWKILHLIPPYWGARGRQCGPHAHLKNISQWERLSHISWKI